MRRFAILVGALLVGCGGDTPRQEADLVLHGGHVVTVDSARPEAEAVAVLGDRIMMVGSDGEVEAHIGPDTRVIDLDGRLVVPGFIEGHGHFMGVGNAQLNLDLTTAASWAEMWCVPAGGPRNRPTRARESGTFCSPGCLTARGHRCRSRRESAWVRRSARMAPSASPNGPKVERRRLTSS